MLFINHSVLSDCLTAIVLLYFTAFYRVVCDRKREAGASAVLVSLYFTPDAAQCSHCLNNKLICKVRGAGVTQPAHWIKLSQRTRVPFVTPYDLMVKNLF